MTRILTTLLLLAIHGIPFTQTKRESQPRPLVFTHVTVIDATGARAKPDMTVVVVGDHIVSIDSSTRERVSKDAQVVDATGKFLIPGLWDMHVHAFDKNLFSPLFIANGITGVRDMFSSLATINQWRKEIKAGTIIGPHIVAAGPIVDGPKPVVPGSIAVGNAAEGIKAVNTAKQGGSDFVKVYSLLPRDAYFAIATEAKR